jgi:hypothetical protein
VKAGKDTSENMKNMKAFLRRNGAPANLGFMENTCFAYNPTNTKVTEIMKRFWKVYIGERITYRDQPLWGYISWKYSLDVTNAPHLFVFSDRTRHSMFIKAPWRSNSCYVKKGKTIYIVVKEIASSCAILRAAQIKEVLGKGRAVMIIDRRQLYRLDSAWNDIIIWVGAACLRRRNTYVHQSNINILDVVDKYLYYKSDIESGIKQGLYQKVIVNSVSMRDEFHKKYSRYIGSIHVIRHHWDPRLERTKTLNSGKLIFGYMGSILSLEHTNNFLHYRKLKDKYNIIFYDTDSGRDVTNYIKQDNFSFFSLGQKHNGNNMPASVSFNCDINIREYNTPVSKYKTTAKVATAAALGHNILTTLDSANTDVLPADYPFILRDTNLSSICDMMNIIKKDFEGNKTLWNKGLGIMAELKSRLDLNVIKNDYIEMIESCENK